MPVQDLPQPSAGSGFPSTLSTQPYTLDPLPSTLNPDLGAPSESGGGGMHMFLKFMRFVSWQEVISP